jgi:predicted ATP-grasp superfamily ATP-dependent carboligase
MRASGSGPQRTGAVVVGGDYQGLGIVRSLGERGVPTCVVDDELSIARFSRYAAHAARCKDLRDEEAAVAALIEVGGRLGLDGWVLYPTRDETVAALARHRSALAERFRVPTPAWEVVRYASDKRQTYALGQRLGIPVPRTWCPHTVDELETIDADLPLAI